jgi:hypothetical protein
MKPPPFTSWLVALLLSFLTISHSLAALLVTGGSNFSIGIPAGSTNPSTTTGTDFGSVTVPGSVSHTFRLKNDSNAVIQLVSLGLTGPAFSITNGAVSSTINLAANATRDFTIAFNPVSAGTKTGTVTIVAVGITPFTFDLAGEALGAPEIVVRGRPNSPLTYLNITDGDTTPDVGNGTDFSNYDISAGALTRTFEIENSGTAQLVIDSITENSPAFSITGIPSVVGVGKTATFSVKFNPVTQGDVSATVTIANNDASENPFTFSVKGSGRGPAISVLGGTAQNFAITNGDNTPSLLNNTDFGTVVAGSPSISRTFKIANNGNENLVFTSVTDDSVAFSVTSAPALNTPLAPGASTTFNVVLDTKVAGLKSGTILILTNDPENGVFSFDVAANATGNPEIVVEGEDTVLKTRDPILDGESAVSVADGTTFGTLPVSNSSVSHNFFIRNTGNAKLNVSAITSSNTEFAITATPGAIAADGELSFSIRFNPAVTGLRSATISIASDDASENPFTFAVSGNGSGGLTEVKGGINFATIIPNGDSSPSTADNTDFGSATAGSGSVTRTFRIFNRGNADLIVSAILDDGAAFSITSNPSPATLTPGNSRDFNIVFAPTSAGAKRATVTVSSNDPVTPAYSFDVSGTATGTAIVAVSGPGIVPNTFAPIPNGASITNSANGTSFGSVLVTDAPVSRTFQIANTGSAQLSITAITDNSPAFSISNIPAVVGVNQTKNFTITFDPASPAYFYATISVTSSTSPDEAYSFRVDGTGTGGQLELRPEATSGFGPAIPNGDSSPSIEEGTAWAVDLDGTPMYYRDFKATNIGNAPLTIHGFNFNSPAWSWITGFPQAFPIVLNPGASTMLSTIQFQPVAAGSKYTTVTIDLLGGVTSRFSFDMSGEATGTPGLSVSGRSLDLAGTLFVSIPDASTTITPSNGTEFGEVNAVSGSVSHTFEIANSGSSQLEISAITENSPHFRISGAPTIIGVNQSKTFTITFDPSATGTKSTTITISSNAPGDAAAYSFNVRGTGTGPDIAISGGINFAIPIATGDVSPSSADGTDFGSTAITGSIVTRKFRIDNTGNDALSVVAATSSNNAFSVSGIPGVIAPIAPGGSVEFSVSFDPATTGPASSIIALASNDPDEMPFTFTVSGYGIDDHPFINVRGKRGDVIHTGPTLDLGTVDAGSLLTAVFAIENTGSGILTVSSVTETSNQFNIASAPTAPIAPDASDDFRIRFQSPTAGTFTTTITIASDADNIQAFTFSVRATASASSQRAVADLEVYGGSDLDAAITNGDADPRRFDGTDAGPVEIGQSIQRTFRIRNAGAAPLAISGINLTGATGSVSAFPPALQPNSFADISVTLAPSSPGPQLWNLAITSSDPDEASFSFAITAEGVPASFRTAITNLAIVGTSAELTFVSNPLKTYRIAYSSDLSTWSRTPALSNIPGDASPQTYVLLNATSIIGPKAFFRVEEE